MPKQNNHDKRTHDSLVNRVYDELKQRYGYTLKKEMQYPRGELDIVRYKNGEPITYYEIKSNNLQCNYHKAVKQGKRYINWKEGTIDTEEMDVYRNAVYVSQEEIGGSLVAEKVL